MPTLWPSLLFHCCNLFPLSDLSRSVRYRTKDVVIRVHCDTTEGLGAIVEVMIHEKPSPSGAPQHSLPISDGQKDGRFGALPKNLSQNVGRLEVYRPVKASTERSNTVGIPVDRASYHGVTRGVCGR